MTSAEIPPAGPERAARTAAPIDWEALRARLSPSAARLAGELAAVAAREAEPARALEAWLGERLTRLRADFARVRHPDAPADRPGERR